MQENMKKINRILYNWHTAAFVLLTALLAACTADPIEMEVGSGAAYDPVGKVKPGFYSPKAINDTVVRVTVKPGEKFEDVLTFGLTKEAPEDVTVTFSLADDEETLEAYDTSLGLHDAKLSMENMSEQRLRMVNRKFRYVPAEKRTLPTGEMTIRKGSYGIELPVKIDMSDPEESCCNFLVMLNAEVPAADGSVERYHICYQLSIDLLSSYSYDFENYADKYGKPAFDWMAILIDPAKIDPRAVREVSVYSFFMNFETGDESEHLYRCVDEALIWGATIGYDADNKLPKLLYDTHLTHLLLDRKKYLAPIQKENICVSVIINGAGLGIGFCNLDDAQRASLVEQVRQMVVRYDLDGVNLYDEGSGYGRDGMPAIDPASYAKFIRDLRTALGKDKRITLTDVGDPSATLYQTHDGIEAGAYLDYAWTGKSWDFTDPYTVSSDRTIKGLDHSKYGIAFGRYRDNVSYNEQMVALPKLQEALEAGAPRIAVSEMMPIVRGIESASGITIFQKWVEWVFMPAVEADVSMEIFSGNGGYAFQYVGASPESLGFPEYGNMLYYPDWLRF